MVASFVCVGFIEIAALKIEWRSRVAHLQESKSRKCKTVARHERSVAGPIEVVQINWSVCIYLQLAATRQKRLF